jgi:hypothetical protein
MRGASAWRAIRIARGTRDPGEVGIFVALAIGALADVGAGREDVVDLAGDLLGKAPLPVVDGAARHRRPSLP